VADPQPVTSPLPRFIVRELERASDLGLVARWSSEFDYISVHDPTTGEWHDLAMQDAPPWAKAEAFKRKELRTLHGVTRLLSRAELEDIYHEEREREAAALADEGLVEGTAAVDEHGNIYEDYIQD
jgi:hypothetical protein